MVVNCAVCSKEIEIAIPKYVMGAANLRSFHPVRFCDDCYTVDETALDKLLATSEEFLESDE